MLDEMETLQRPVNYAVKRLEHPPPNERAERGGHDERQQHGAADQPLEARDAEQQERQSHAEHGFGNQGSRGEDDAVLQRLQEDRAREQTVEVIKSDETAGTADTGVAQAKPDREHEWIADQYHEQKERRCNERVGDV